MYIYVIQSYDKYCHKFNPYVVAFKHEKDAEKQVELYDSLGEGLPCGDGMSYSYVKVWFNEDMDDFTFTGDSDHEHG